MHMQFALCLGKGHTSHAKGGFKEKAVSGCLTHSGHRAVCSINLRLWLLLAYRPLFVLPCRIITHAR
eukprot:scaffold206576_cov10-Tisochrysis_lutea.AAC.1